MARAKPDSPLLFDLPDRPDFTFELKAGLGCGGPVAGVDEAGRGPLAGPVVAAAVILDGQNLPEGLDDSKRMTAAARERLFAEILAAATSVAVASVSASAIDSTDIRLASLEAMRRAIIALAAKPGHVLADGRDVPPGLRCPATAVIKGDRRCMSIAAASIVAKVTRDRMMARVAALHQTYGFERHMGYGTEAHRAQLEILGPVVRLHRFSFAPVKDFSGPLGEHETELNLACLPFDETV